MLACLVRISPLHRITNERGDVRVSSVNDAVNGPKVNALGGVIWEPALVGAPVLSFTVWNGDFQAAVSAGNASLVINTKTLKESYPFADDCAWIGAPVEIYAEKPGTPWPWAARFVGKVSGFSRKGDSMTLGCEVDQEPFEAKVLTATYAGTGLIEGSSDLKNRVKPLVVGWAQNVEPILINAVDNVYQFSAYGAIEAVSTLYERGASFGSAVGNYATYAALVAATIPAGRWGTCLAQGLVRLGAPAAGVITGDIKGHCVGSTTPRLSGAIVSALASIAGIDGDLLNSDAWDAMDAARPYPAAVSLQEQTTFKDIAEGMALCCNYQAGTALDGRFTSIRIALDGEEQFTLDALGRALPQVKEAEELDVSAPYWKITIGSNRAWRVHTADEIAFFAKLNPRGRYVGTESYREGDMVDIADGSQWLYINPVASTGNAPPTWPTTSNAYWENITPPTKAQDITFNDGQTVEDLQPAEADSDVTSVITGVAEISIAADYTGTVTAALPRTQAYKLIRNGVDVTTSSTWSVSVLTGTIAANIGSATGVLSLDLSSGVLTNATVRISVDYNGFVRTFDVKVTKSNGTAPSTGGGGTGTSSSTSFSGSTTSTTMAAVGPELTITVGSGGQATLTASYAFDVSSSSSSFHEYARWYRWNGSAYVAIGSEVQSSVAATYNVFSLEGTTGYGECNFTDTGLTAGSSQQYRLYMRNASGAAPRSITGTVAAVGS